LPRASTDTAFRFARIGKLATRIIDRVGHTRGDDDTIASGDVQPHAETVPSVNVELGSAKTIGSELLATTMQELPVVPYESYVRIDEYARGGLGRIAALATVGNVSVWDVSGRVVREIRNGNFPATSIAFSNDGKWLARSGEPADTLFALDGGSDRKLLDTGRQGVAVGVAFSPDDKTVLVSGVGFLSTWDTATAAPRIRIATEGFTSSSAFLDNGSYIVGGGADRRVHVWNADTGAELLAFTVPTPPRKIVIDRNSARVAVLAGPGAIVWTVPAFPGTLDDLLERARCLLDVEVVDAHLRQYSIDIAACKRVAW
jgi:WD40 repeat protein